MQQFFLHSVVGCCKGMYFYTVGTKVKTIFGVFVCASLLQFFWTSKFSPLTYTSLFSIVNWNASVAIYADGKASLDRRYQISFPSIIVSCVLEIFIYSTPICSFFFLKAIFNRKIYATIAAIQQFFFRIPNYCNFN